MEMVAATRGAGPPPARASMNDLSILTTSTGSACRRLSEE